MCGSVKEADIEQQSEKKSTLKQEKTPQK